MSALPSGDHSTSYGPWEPIFPDQTCAGCGTEHPGLPCDRQEGLW